MDWATELTLLCWNYLLLLAFSGFLTTLLLRLFAELLVNVEVRPTLHCRTSAFSKSLLRNFPELNQEVRVPKFCAFKFAENICGSVYRNLIDLVALITNQLTISRNRVFVIREYLQLEDDGLVSLDWIFSHKVIHKLQKPSKDTNIVVLLPGEFAFDSVNHLGIVCEDLIVNNYRPLIFNQRGFASTPLTTPRIQCHGDSSDLREVFQYLEETYPGSFITCIGFSTGASLLVSYLGEFGSSAIVKSAVVTSPLWDFRTIHENLPMITKLWWTFKLRSWFLRIIRIVYPSSSATEILLSSSEDLFMRVYLPFSNYKGQDEYFENCSPLQDADDIAVPLLVLHCNDDPFVPEDSLPTELFTLYPHLLLLRYPYGGHCGILQDWSDPRRLIYHRFFEEVKRFTAKETHNERNRVTSLNFRKTKQKFRKIRSTC